MRTTIKLFVLFSFSSCPEMKSNSTANIFKRINDNVDENIQPLCFLF